MIRKGLQIINILALVLSGFAYSWVYTEHTDLAPTENKQLYTKKLQEINTFNNMDTIKSSYIEYINASKKNINVHNYQSEKIINALLAVIILLGISFIFIIILSEQYIKMTNENN